MNKKLAVLLLSLAGFLISVSCNLFEAIGADDFFSALEAVVHSNSVDPEIQIMETSFPNTSDEIEEPAIEFGGVSADNTNNEGAANCTQFKIIEEDIKQNPALVPEIMIWANADKQIPPDGFQISYDEYPATQEFSDTARLLSHDGSQITISTSVNVSCANVMILGTTISPLEIYLDGNLVWEGYLYPREEEGNYQFYYFQIPVESPHPVSLKIIGYSFPPDDLGNTFAAWVPVEFFGFELP